MNWKPLISCLCSLKYVPGPGLCSYFEPPARPCLAEEPNPYFTFDVSSITDTVSSLSLNFRTSVAGGVGFGFVFVPPAHGLTNVYVNESPSGSKALLR